MFFHSYVKLPEGNWRDRARENQRVSLWICTWPQDYHVWIFDDIWYAHILYIVCKWVLSRRKHPTRYLHNIIKISLSLQSIAGKKKKTREWHLVMHHDTPEVINSPCKYFGIFQHINHPAFLGYPPWLWKHPQSISTWGSPDGALWSCSTWHCARRHRFYYVGGVDYSGERWSPSVLTIKLVGFSYIFFP